MSCPRCGSVVIDGRCQFCAPIPNPSIRQEEIFAVAVIGIGIGLYLSVNGKTPHIKTLGNMMGGACIGATLSYSQFVAERGVQVPEHIGVKK